jgi:hypothetical protein
MHGKGTYVWPDGRKYQGDYINDKKDGHGYYEFGDGRRYDGQWLNGKMHGVGKIMSKEGEARRALFDDSIRIKWIDSEEEYHEILRNQKNNL